MSSIRPYCARCQQPLAACICALITEVNNQTEVIIWQHPNETNHPKGTATLLALCLTNCRTVVGERLSAEELGVNKERCVLLYPAKDTDGDSGRTDKSSDSIATTQQGRKPTQLLIIDGTWRKSRRIVYSNPWLSELERFTLTSNKRLYTIRKPESEHQLSTFEACSYALKVLDSECVFSSLKNTFAQFIALQTQRTLQHKNNK